MYVRRRRKRRFRVVRTSAGGGLKKTRGLPGLQEKGRGARNEKRNNENLGVASVAGRIKTTAERGKKGGRTWVGGGHTKSAWFQTWGLDPTLMGMGPTSGGMATTGRGKAPSRTFLKKENQSYAESGERAKKKKFIGGGMGVDS